MNSKSKSVKRSIGVSSMITAVVVVATTGYILFHSINALSRTYIEDSWQITQGIVLNPDIQLKGKKNIDRKTEGLEQLVNYEYEIDGTVYQSNAASKESYVLLNEFPEGKVVDVYYNPTDATDSVLIRSAIQKHFIYVVIAFCLLIIGVVVYSLSKDLKRK